MPVQYHCACGDCHRTPMLKSRYCKPCRNAPKWRPHDHDLQ